MSLMSILAGRHREIAMGINIGLGAGSCGVFVVDQRGYTGANGEIVACDWPGGGGGLGGEDQ